MSENTGPSSARRSDSIESLLRTFLQGQQPGERGSGAATPASAPTTTTHTIPLAQGRVAEVVVPVRFTPADAERIAAVLTALAVED